MAATGHTISIIAQGTTINGDLEAVGHILVEGVVAGSSHVKGMLTVSASGTVKGDVRADVVVVQGHVTGNIHALDRLELHESAIVDGDVAAANLVIRAGAVINGASRMLAVQSTQRPRFLPNPDRLLGGALRRLTA